MAVNRRALLKPWLSCRDCRLLIPRERARSDVARCALIYLYPVTRTLFYGVHWEADEKAPDIARFPQLGINHP
jgi:hypothetical protein